MQVNLWHIFPICHSQKTDYSYNICTLFGFICVYKKAPRVLLTSWAVNVGEGDKQKCCNCLQWNNEFHTFVALHAQIQLSWKKSANKQCCRFKKEATSHTYLVWNRERTAADISLIILAGGRCVVMEVSVLGLVMNKLFLTDCPLADASANPLHWYRESCST